jgi:hypothetical protein
MWRFVVIFFRNSFVQNLMKKEKVLIKGLRHTITWLDELTYRAMNSPFFIHKIVNFTGMVVVNEEESY